MKVTILQTDISWGNTTLNQFSVESIIEKLPQTDMYVLPEMWSTGFAIVPSAIAEDEEESLRHGSLAWMKKMAEKTDAAICGSLAVRLNDGTYANRMYFIYPDGKTNSYSKRHLFSPGGEDRSYKAGKEISRCKVPSTNMLRFTVSCMEPQPRRLRCHHICGKLACTTP